jgi:FkbM family methyltransferase
MTRNANYHLAKYRVKISHFTEQGYDLQGVIHVGANDGYEFQWYKMMGIENLLAFEPLPSAIHKFIETYPGVPCLGMALSDFDGGAELNVAYGDGKGSSLLPPIEDHPEVQAHWNLGQSIMIDKQIVTVARYDTLVAQGHIDPDLYDTLVLDTQGNELEVLKGCGDLLQRFKFLSVELSVDPVYEGEHPGEQVAAWLEANGFTRDSPIFPHDDCFFVRSDIKPTSEQIYRGLA